jgi:hypothetical protein
MIKSSLFCLVGVLIISCSLDDPKEGVNPSQIIKWDRTKIYEVSANGSDKIDINVNLVMTDPNLPITFTTQQGSFAGATDDSPRLLRKNAFGKEATVTLIGDLVPNETVIVTASVGNFTIDTLVNFKAAKPDAIYITSSKITAKADMTEQISFTVWVSREEGTGNVSNQLRVKLTQGSQTNGAVADLVSFVSLSNQTATFVVKSANQNPGDVVITASITGNTGGDNGLTAERKITFIN